MHTLATLSSLIWGIDYLLKGATVMVIANFAGVACEIIVVIAYLYAIGSIGENHPLVSFAHAWQYVLYRLPSKIFGGGSSSPAEDSKAKKE